VVIRYWPGSGVVCNEHDLLDVGDDAVFGSRSTVITCDAKEAATVRGKSRPILPRGVDSFRPLICAYAPHHGGLPYAQMS